MTKLTKGRSALGKQNQMKIRKKGKGEWTVWQMDSHSVGKEYLYIEKEAKERWKVTKGRQVNKRVEGKRAYGKTVGK